MDDLVEYEVTVLERNSYPLWNKFVDDSDDAWFWHSGIWMDYTVNYNPLIKSENISFFVIKSNEIQAIVPFFVEKSLLNENDFEFSFGGSFLPLPAFRNDLSLKKREKIATFISNYINDLSVKYFAKRYVAKDSPSRISYASYLNKPFYNPISNFNMMECNFVTSLLNLNQSVEELYLGIRKGHRRELESLLKTNSNIKFEVYNNQNIDSLVFDSYKKMHIKTSGRQTRPDITFSLMEEMILKDNAVLFSLNEGEVERVFMIAIFFKDTAYLASIADDPDFVIDNRGWQTALHWDVMKWLKENGCKYIDYGIQFVTKQLYAHQDRKLSAISHYLSGFGGKNVPLFCGEKYFSAHYLEKVYNQRISEFIKNNNLIHE